MVLDINKLSQRLCDISEKIGMQVAAHPHVDRVAAYGLAEMQLRDFMQQFGKAIVGPDAVIEIQMDIIRKTVARIDAGGCPEGGHT